MIQNPQLNFLVSLYLAASDYVGKTPKVIFEGDHMVELETSPYRVSFYNLDTSSPKPARVSTRTLFEVDSKRENGTTVIEKFCFK